MSEIIDPGGGRWATEKDQRGGWHLITIDPMTRYFPCRLTPKDDHLEIEWGELRESATDSEPTKHEFRRHES